MFEYQTLTVGWDQLQDVLNSYGTNGWRLTHIEGGGEGKFEYRVVIEREQRTVVIQPFQSQWGESSQ